MLKREIEICGKKVAFRSSATIPHLYRAKFKRDIFKDLMWTEKANDGAKYEKVAREAVQADFDAF